MGTKFTPRLLAWTCGISDGAVYCWGEGFQSTMPQSTKPALIRMPDEVRLVNVDVGFGPTCALAANGSVYCWGYLWSEDGPQWSDTPTRIPAAMPLRSIEVGNASACAMTTESVVYCWLGVVGVPRKMSAQP